MNPFVGVHVKASSDAEGQFRPGSHPAPPRGWRNSFSIERAVNGNVGERAISPVFHTTPNPYTIS
ncbi:hypothetical protein [Desulfosporosinus nitroreducens]|uniref:Uncharacterized protein n=1 Tax=Desulfosporosinus nitroreducens TaxID=2018668 RepID=A0ABT8QLM9_9FIRM|nr:hypothetical protein [Desulfosporosinus nitroreducens]MDO0822238.1 hypothetical protein [Desulfosporosinus nitroreducens]